jgi:NitT/TauT family transport system substrate-binding protein
MTRKTSVRAGLAVLAAVLLAGCGGTPSRSAGTDPGAPVRLGYLPNITHATPLLGVSTGAFRRSLGTSYPLTAATFNAGPDVVQALLSNSIDVAYLGPSPVITAFAQSHGRAIRVVAGSASGGASLVVKPSISSAADLRGKTVATPQLGNTQDVALRAWLLGRGLKPSQQSPGDVTVQPMDNAQGLQAFRQGQIDGAWVPEPWASRYVIEAGARVLVDEASLWPHGTFATTILVVRTEFLTAHPAAIRRLLDAQVRLTDQLSKDPAGSQTAVNAALQVLTGKALPSVVLAQAWGHITFTDDPMASSIAADAQHAQQVGLPAKANLAGLYDVSLLNDVLAESGRPEVTAS